MDRGKLFPLGNGEFFCIYESLGNPSALKLGKFLVSVKGIEILHQPLQAHIHE